MSETTAAHAPATDEAAQQAAKPARAAKQGKRKTIRQYQEAP